MPWHASQSSSCPSSRPWAVIKDADGSVVACHPTKAAALNQVAALYANEPGAHSMTMLEEQRAKYNADDLAKMAKNGQAMPDGGYPIGDEEDLRNAIRAVGRGSGSHDAIRRHIMKRARALGLADLIPDNWNADGSIASEDVDGLVMRAVPFMVTRAEIPGDGFTLEGYAAVFNSPTLINDWQGEYEETIVPGAFKRTIAGGNPVLQFDHGTHPVLGSLPIGSIQSLKEDGHGLYVRARLFDNWMTEPLRQAISAEPPAVDGMSFRFKVIQESWDQTVTPEQRTIKEVKLYELGPVVFPAYKDTSVSLRSLAAHVPGIRIVLEQEETPPAGTPDEPDTARTSDGPAASNDPTVDDGHSWTLQQRRQWMASFHDPKEAAQ